MRCKRNERTPHRPRIRKASPSELGNETSAITIKYGSNGYDISIPRGGHAWIVDHGSWNNVFLTRREARMARTVYLTPRCHWLDWNQCAEYDRQSGPIRFYDPRLAPCASNDYGSPCLAPVESKSA